MEIQYGKAILHGIIAAVLYLVVPLLLFYFLELYGIMAFSDVYRIGIIVFGIIGIVILFIISDNLEINEKDIDKINKANVEEDVKIKGIISKITQLDKVAFIELEQPAKMTIIVFKDKRVFGVVEVKSTIKKEWKPTKRDWEQLERIKKFEINNNIPNFWLVIKDKNGISVNGVSFQDGYKRIIYFCKLEDWEI